MRIQGVDAAAVTGDVADVLAGMVKQFGQVLPSTAIQARRPSIMLGHMALARGIEASGLIDSGLQGLVNRRIAVHNWCPF